jgi:hypothetical protein
VSLYNQLFGVNPLARVYGATLAVADMKESGKPKPSRCPSARLRDMWTEKVDGDLRIVVYARTGGGNREAYDDEIQSARTHPLFVRDYDDTFDSTYMYFEFRVPDFAQEKLLELHEVFGPYQRPEERWRSLLDKLDKMPPDAKEQAKAEAEDPDLKRAMDVGRQVLGLLSEKLEEGGGIVEV